MDKVLVVVFVISRFLFINPQPIFFDSQEYLDLFARQSLGAALIDGHVPQHLGHVLIYWPVFQLTQSPIMVVLFQVLLSTVTLIAFYRLVKWLTNPKVALRASIFVSLMPMWWIATVTQMMESTYVAAFILSWYFLMRYLEKINLRDAGLTVILGAFGVMTQPIAVLWLPVYLAMTLYKKRDDWGRVLLMVGLMAFLGLGISLWAVSAQRQTDLGMSAQILFGGKKGELAESSFTITDGARLLRNALIPLIRTQTLGLVIVGLMGIGMAIWNNWWLAVWVAPFLMVNQFWDALFPGRHALLAGFGLAIGAAYGLKSKPKLFAGMVIYMVMTVIPAMTLLRSPVPYIELQREVSQLPKQGLLIVSHFARPQVQGRYDGEVVYVNEPIGNDIPLPARIDAYLKQGKPVLISGDALSEPYGLYTGPYLHNLTLSYAHDFALKDDLSGFTITHDSNMFYKVKLGEGSYPSVPNLWNNPRRLDYTDPITWVWLKIF